MSNTNEPVAYAVMQPDSYVVVHTRHAASVMRDTCGGGEVVPLYRSPTLTDAEREAVESCIADDEAATSYERADTLRSLLERMSNPPADDEP